MQIPVLRRLLFCCLLAGGLPAWSGAAPADTLRIGVSGPFSGGSSPMGQSMLNGILLATEEINSIGGINGKKIELVLRDDQADPKLGAQIAEELASSKVVAAIGIVNTGVGLASIDAYQKAKIPLMVAVSTGTSLTRKYAPPAAPENYIFRVSPTLDLEARVLATDLRRKGLQSAALLADTTAYGEAGLQAFLKHAKAVGVNVVSQERFNLGDQDMSRQVHRAKASDAQAIVVWGIGPELAAIARNKDEAGWKVPMLGSWTLSMRNFIDLSGKAGENALMPQTFIQDATSSSKTGFLLAYQRKFKVTLISSPMSAAQGYDGMRLLDLALRQANSTDGAAIRLALENLDKRYQGVITSYNKPFSAQDHDAITQNMLLMGQVSGGQVGYAYTDDLKRSGLLRLKSAAR